MSWDLFGQLFGKNKRRQIEAEVAGAAKPVALALPQIGSRLAAAGIGYIVTAALHGSIPHDQHTLALAATGALGAVVLAAPDAFAASGLLRAVSPGTISLAQAAGQAISGLVTAPKAQREQQIQTIATQAALAAVMDWQNRTGSFTADQLAGKSPLPAGLAVNDPSEPAGTPTATVLGAPAGISGGQAQVEGQAAIDATGGTQ